MGKSVRPGTIARVEIIGEARVTYGRALHAVVDEAGGKATTQDLLTIRGRGTSFVRPERRLEKP